MKKSTLVLSLLALIFAGAQFAAGAPYHMSLAKAKAYKKRVDIQAEKAKQEAVKKTEAAEREADNIAEKAKQEADARANDEKAEIGNNNAALKRIEAQRQDAYNKADAAKKARYARDEKLKNDVFIHWQARQKEAEIRLETAQKEAGR